MIIKKDTIRRGTREQPCYVVFLRYGALPAQECWLDALDDDAAIAEARRRFPETTEFYVRG